MTDETRAELLARWLEESAGAPTEPPSGLDPDVVEAIVAVRPDLAPPPRVSAEDILASVTAGPFAEPDAPNVVRLPLPAAAVASEAPPPSSSQRPGRRRWWTGVGVAVAVAATLLVAVQPALRPEPAPEAAAPPQAPARKAAEPTAEVAAAPVPDLEEAADAVAVVEPEPAQGPAPLEEPAPRVAPNAVATGRAMDPGVQPNQQASAGYDAYDDAVADLYEVPEEEAFGSLDLLRPGAEAAEAQDAAAPLDEPPAVAEAETTSGGLFSRREARRAERKQAAPKAERAAAPAGAPPPAAPVAQAADPSVLRAPAVPTDLGDWRSTVAAADLPAIDAALAAGDPSALAAWVRAPAPAGMTVARLAAEGWLAVGDAAAAADIARRGLALSAANTPERSALLVALGDASLRRGDIAGAEAAWREAAALNAAR